MSVDYKQDYHHLASVHSATSKYTESNSDNDSLAKPLAGGDNALFQPTSSLQVQQKGMSAGGCNMLTKEKDVAIFDVDTGRPRYLRVMSAKRWNESCHFVDADDPSATSIAAIKLSSLHNPQVRIGRDDDVNADCFKVPYRNLWLSRASKFTSARWGADFEWRYCGRRERKQYHATSLLVLDRIDTVQGKEQRRRVAQLVRSDEYRTPGTSRWGSANGGRLQMRLANHHGEKEADELMVVVTLQVALHKELERARTSIMAAAA